MACSMRLTCAVPQVTYVEAVLYDTCIGNCVSSEWLLGTLTPMIQITTRCRRMVNAKQSPILEALK